MNDDEENYSDLSAIELKAHKEEFYQILKSSRCKKCYCC